VAQEAQQWRRAVVVAESAAEAAAGDEAAPALAYEGGVEEPRWVIGREPEEDLLHDLVHQPRRRRRHAASWPEWS
jgi:hypothetical protein